MVEDPQMQDMKAFLHIITTAEERFSSRFLDFGTLRKLKVLKYPDSVQLEVFEWNDLNSF
jgi:hypothetical protein